MDKHIATLEELRSFHKDFAFANIEEASRIIPALDAAIALMRGQSWQDIATAPAETEVLVYDQTQEPSVFSAKLTDGYEGPYWHPSEQLVADVMDSYLHPTHWRPLDAPTPPEGLSR